jgi:ABC-type dipeptide/oligopeptide/nickel transport system permease component
MRNYIARRLIQLIIVIFGITLILFFILRLIPGTPCNALLGEYVRPETIEKCKTDKGYDKPVWQQYLNYLGKLIQGDLGRSLYYRRPAIEVFLERFPVTLFLTIYSISLSILISVPVGILAALKKNSFIDQFIRTISTISISMPSFWIGLILLLLFSARLKIFPVSGYGDNLGEHLRHLFLPSLTIAFTISTLLIRNLRNSLLEITQTDYVRMALAKGLPWRLVVIKHIFRNSLISYTTLLGVNLTWVIGGTVVIEQVFGLPGIGSLLVSSIFNRDYDLIQSNILIYALNVVLLNLLVDIIYPILDPRVRYS